MLYQRRIKAVYRGLIKETKYSYTTTVYPMKARPEYILRLLCVLDVALGMIPVPTVALGMIPVPTEAQLRYQRHEVAALIHFGMETFACAKSVGYYGCRKCWNASCPQVPGLGKNPASFGPDKLDTDNWVSGYRQLGKSKNVTLGFVNVERSRRVGKAGRLTRP